MLLLISFQLFILPLLQILFIFIHTTLLATTVSSRKVHIFGNFYFFFFTIGKIPRAIKFRDVLNIKREILTLNVMQKNSRILRAQSLWVRELLLGNRLLIFINSISFTVYDWIKLFILSKNIVKVYQNHAA